MLWPLLLLAAALALVIFHIVQTIPQNGHKDSSTWALVLTIVAVGFYFLTGARGT